MTYTKSKSFDEFYRKVEHDHLIRQARKTEQSIKEFGEQSHNFLLSFELNNIKPPSLPRNIPRNKLIICGFNGYGKSQSGRVTSFTIRNRQSAVEKLKMRSKPYYAIWYDKIGTPWPLV